MSVKLLIDAVVNQTTVLIAQLSTAAGIKAPLSHVADQVFLSLAREIEAQGVGRKVVADMFGMALRAYQKKVQRLTESATDRNKTLWETVLEFITENGPVVRSRVIERFALDGERETVAVLTDLVGSGLIHASGRGAASIYGVTTTTERERLSSEADDETRLGMIWGSIYRTPGLTQHELQAEARCSPDALAHSLQRLEDEGRITKQFVEDTEYTESIYAYHAANFLIPVGTNFGWESALFDHFQAVTQAMGAKLQQGLLRSDVSDVIGGSTLRFQLSRNHPQTARVLGTLGRVRRDLDDLWRQVSDYNDTNPIDLDERIDVCFYYGQNVSGEAFETRATPTSTGTEPSEENP